ncbi:MAG TPA: hypothetical protein VLJ11_17580 [Bryobacteraceae bacterium]|nr:hypothetical protein [Bryobacteraceae bacterium]
MNWNRKSLLLLGAAAVCFTTGSLRAADVAGSFTLPSQTNWGLAALSPGQYTFTLNRSAIDGRIIVYKGTKPVLMVLSQGVAESGTSGESSMKIVNGRVRYLRLAPAGLTFSYAPHKKEAQLMAGRPAQRETSLLVATK